MLRYIGREVLGLDLGFDPPKERLWQGIYHPDAETAFEETEEYLRWYKPTKEHKIGLLFFRTYWTNGDLEIVDGLIQELERDFDVIPAFSLGMRDADIGAKSSGDMARSFFSGAGGWTP